MDSDNGLQLLEDENGLYLTDGKLVYRPDLTHMIPRVKKGIIGTELLVRAARLKDMSGQPTLIDATAGLGEDSLLLAAAGFSVKLYEYDHVIAALLSDSLRKAAADPVLGPIVAHMEVVEGDSIAAMKAMSGEQAGAAGTARSVAEMASQTVKSGTLATPDVIYLDPMFPERTKAAMIKKKFQLLQQLERPCSNETELLEAALAAHPHKIVIKRPLKGPNLAGVKPAYSIEGKAIRYDCLVLA